MDNHLSCWLALLLNTPPIWGNSDFIYVRNLLSQPPLNKDADMGPGTHHSDSSSWILD